MSTQDVGVRMHTVVFPLLMMTLVLPTVAAAHHVAFEQGLVSAAPTSYVGLSVDNLAREQMGLRFGGELLLFKPVSLVASFAYLPNTATWAPQAAAKLNLLNHGSTAVSLGLGSALEFEPHGHSVKVLGFLAGLEELGRFGLEASLATRVPMAHEDEHAEHQHRNASVALGLSPRVTFMDAWVLSLIFAGEMEIGHVEVATDVGMGIAYIVAEHLQVSASGTAATSGADRVEGLQATLAVAWIDHE